ncbi:hypothetical protein BC567DRAFT_212964 [Phyllosticta citribraziliensis]
MPVEISETWRRRRSFCLTLLSFMFFVELLIGLINSTVLVMSWLGTLMRIARAGAKQEAFFVERGDVKLDERLLLGTIGLETPEDALERLSCIQILREIGVCAAPLESLAHDRSSALVEDIGVQESGRGEAPGGGFEFLASNDTGAAAALGDAMPPLLADAKIFILPAR